MLQFGTGKVSHLNESLGRDANLVKGKRGGVGVQNVVMEKGGFLRREPRSAERFADDDEKDRMSKMVPTSQ
jgi:hypothetical protein